MSIAVRGKISCIAFVVVSILTPIITNLFMPEIHSILETVVAYLY